MTLPTVAFLGIGLMGKPMATRLAQAGYPLRVWNRTAAKAEALRATGAEPHADLHDAMRGADIVITILEAGPVVGQVIADALPALSKGTLWIDMSSTRQDEALTFYVDLLGLEVSADVDFGPMRWLTVRVPGDRKEILLERPGPPAHDEATAERVRDLVTKGAGGGWLAFATDDVDGTFDRLVAAGVDVTQEPMDQPYGRDFGIRDPFGNHLRIGNVRS